MISSLITFIIITIIYFIFKYQNYNNQLYLLIYYLAVLISQYVFNLNEISSKCGGNKNWTKALTITLIPWIFIFGLLHIMLTLFSSWKLPFSNTIGYVVTYMFGIRTLLTDFIIDESKKNGSEDITNAIQHIYSDPSLLINEITPETFENFWERMNSLFKPDASEHKEELYKLVILKDIVSEFLWYVLTGGLISSICLNYISTSKCETSAQEMKDKHDEYEENIKNINNTKNNQTVYTITD